MSDKMTSAVVFVQGMGSVSNVLEWFCYLGSKYGHGLDVIMKLFTHPLNEQTCQIVLFYFPNALQGTVTEMCNILVIALCLTLHRS